MSQGFEPRVEGFAGQLEAALEKRRLTSRPQTARRKTV
jgi:hypothetical protein